MTGPIDVGAAHRAHVKFLASLERAVEATLQEAGQFAANHVRTKSTFKRQSARGSVKDATKSKIIRTRGGKLVRVTNNKIRNGYNVSAGLEHGTKPHLIRARPGKRLRFKAGGTTLFRSYVNHPGTKPYRFLSAATADAYEYIGPRLANRLRSTARRF